jgi:hypothetical protein
MHDLFRPCFFAARSKSKFNYTELRVKQKSDDNVSVSLFGGNSWNNDSPMRTPSDLPLMQH